LQNSAAAKILPKQDHLEIAVSRIIRRVFGNSDQGISRFQNLRPEKSCNELQFIQREPPQEPARLRPSAILGAGDQTIYQSISQGP